MMHREVDNQLIDRIQHGDEQDAKAAFAELIEKYYPVAFRRIRKQVRPIEEAEDITQDIFLHLTRCIGKFEGRSSFHTWFSSMIQKRLADYLRVQSRRPALVEYDAIRDNRKQRVETDFEVLDMMNALPDAYKQTILLKIYCELDFSQMANALGISYEAARSRYRRSIAYAADKFKDCI